MADYNMKKDVKQSTATSSMVIREWPSVGKYRIRAIRSVDGKMCSIDIREYVSNDEFEGFTRRGLRLVKLSEVKALIKALSYVVESGVIV